MKAKLWEVFSILVLNISMRETFYLLLIRIYESFFVFVERHECRVISAVLVECKQALKVRGKMVDWVDSVWIIKPPQVLRSARVVCRDVLLGGWFAGKTVS